MRCIRNTAGASPAKRWAFKLPNGSEYRARTQEQKLRVSGVDLPARLTRKVSPAYRLNNELVSHLFRQLLSS